MGGVETRYGTVAANEDPKSTVKGVIRPSRPTTAVLVAADPSTSPKTKLEWCFLTAVMAMDISGKLVPTERMSKPTTKGGSPKD